VDLRWERGVLIPTGEPRGVVDRIADRYRAQRVFLELLEKLAAEGQRVSNRSRASNYAPTMFARRSGCEGLRKADFERAMDELFDAGKIAIATHKAADRKLYEVIVRTPDQ
jgi:hypothetical protein